MNERIDHIRHLVSDLSGEELHQLLSLLLHTDRLPAPKAGMAYEPPAPVFGPPAPVRSLDGIDVGDQVTVHPEFGAVYRDNWFEDTRGKVGEVIAINPNRLFPFQVNLPDFGTWGFAASELSLARRGRPDYNFLHGEELRND